MQDDRVNRAQTRFRNAKSSLLAWFGVRYRLERTQRVLGTEGHNASKADRQEEECGERCDPGTDLPQGGLNAKGWRDEGGDEPQPRQPGERRLVADRARRGTSRV